MRSTIVRLKSLTFHMILHYIPPSFNQVQCISFDATSTLCKDDSFHWNILHHKLTYQQHNR